MTVPILDRFFSKVKIEGDHEIWTGAVDDKGYGVFFLSKKRKLRTIRVHVFAYEFYYSVEASEDIHHKCHIKRCVKKEHLEDINKSQHGKLHHSPTHCKRGHEFAIVGQNKSGGCKECAKIHNREYNIKYGKSLRK